MPSQTRDLGVSGVAWQRRSNGPSTVGIDTLARMIVEFTGQVFRWSAGSQAWFFVALPPELSADIREIPRIPRGFGSVRVRARIGRSAWRTSIFPDAGRDAYVLPLKRTVRDAEGLREGEDVTVELDVVDA